MPADQSDQKAIGLANNIVVYWWSDCNSAFVKSGPVLPLFFKGDKFILRTNVLNEENNQGVTTSQLDAEEAEETIVDDTCVLNEIVATIQFSDEETVPDSDLI